MKGKKRKEKNKEGLMGRKDKPKMSKTELLNPIAKYYIIDSQFGYKQNVSLEQNCIQNLEKMFCKGEPDVPQELKNVHIFHPADPPSPVCPHAPLCSASSQQDGSEGLLVFHSWAPG